MSLKYMVEFKIKKNDIQPGTVFEKWSRVLLNTVHVLFCFSIPASFLQELQELVAASCCHSVWCCNIWVTKTKILLISSLNILTFQLLVNPTLKPKLKLLLSGRMGHRSTCLLEQKAITSTSFTLTLLHAVFLFLSLSLRVQTSFLIFHDQFNSVSIPVLTKPIIFELLAAQTHRHARKKARAIQMEIIQAESNNFVTQMHSNTIIHLDTDVSEIGHSSDAVQYVYIYIYTVDSNVCLSTFLSFCLYHYQLHSLHAFSHPSQSFNVTLTLSRLRSSFFSFC